MIFSLLSVNIQIIKKDEEIGEPESCIFSRPYFKVKEDDFVLNVTDVARYRVQKGLNIQVCPYENADKKSVNLFLESTVLGVLLHQRGILSFHGSSFVYKEKGIIICGGSGVGKSAVTAAFCRHGAFFVNDDITPVIVNDAQITILPINTQLKLWEDSLKKLGIISDNLQKIRSRIAKFYLPIQDRYENEYSLDYFFILTTHNKNEFKAIELKGIEKYNALRRQIYCKIYLKGMPVTEKNYFWPLLNLASKVKVIIITRPRTCDIMNTMRFIDNEIKL